MAIKLLICLTLALVLAEGSGCSREPEGPDYELLRSKIAERLDPIDGWTAVDLELMPGRMEGIRRAQVTNLVLRSYKSDVSGQEVQVRLDYGRSGHAWMCLPDINSCMVRRNYDKLSFETLESRTGKAYAFSRVAQLQPDHRYLVWAHTFDGGWTRNSYQVMRGANPFSFTVLFDIASPPEAGPAEISADIKRLIGQVMDQISPPAIAHQLATAAQLQKPKD